MARALDAAGYMDIRAGMQANMRAMLASIPPSKERRSSFLFNLLHTNIIALSVFFLLLLVGYSYNRTRAGLLAIGVGVLGLLTVIGVSIYILLYGWPGA